MAIVRLVRHGRAAAGWDTDPDPGLDDLGVEQARTVARDLQRTDVGVALSSPLRRCLETSSYYSELVGADVIVEPAVAEIPAPIGIDMAGRADWLRRVMTGKWSELDVRYAAYRTSVIDRIKMCDRDTIVFSHFVAINAVIGDAVHDDRLVIRRLDNCSVTSVEVVGGAITLIEGGHEADTLVR